jgi:predicted permease
LPNLGRDFRYGWRRLRRTPAFTAFSIVTLALGIGVTTGVYSAVRALMSPPEGVASPETLVTISRAPSSGAGTGSMVSLSWPEFQELQAQQTTFSSLAGWRFFRATPAANGISLPSFNEAVSGDYFSTLGVRMALGRPLQTADDRPDAPPVVVISHSAWRTLFNGNANAIGQTLKLQSLAATVVGVVSTEFSGLFNGGLVPTATWIPMAALRSTDNRGMVVSFDPASRGQRWIMVTARLTAGRSIDDARAEIANLGARINAANPDDDDPRSRRGQRDRPPTLWSATPLTSVPKPLGTGQVLGPLTATLMTAVLLVLLVACTNLANLMLARAAGRRQESGTRLALGASRWRLVREGLVEALMLSAAGGALALLVAWAAIRILGTELVFNRGISLRLQPHLDVDVLLAAMAAAVLTLIVAGLGPALHASRVDLRTVIATDSLGTASPRWRARRYLIAVQVAVSVVLVVIAGLCVAQVRASAAVDRGVGVDRLALLEVDFASQRIDQAEAARIVDAWTQQLARRPGVEAAAAMSGLPGSLASLVMTRSASVRAVDSSGRVSGSLLAATPDTFRTLGIPLLRGRSLDDRDTAAAAPVAVIGEQTAIALFGRADVVGREVLLQSSTYVNESKRAESLRVIVGVVREPARADSRRQNGVLYVSLAQHHEPNLVLAVRAEDPAAMLLPMRQALETIAPAVAAGQVITGTALAGQDAIFFRIVAGIAAVLGTMAMIVALVGLYGILSFVIAGRTREIGIRLAIGAEARTVRCQVLREGLSPVWIGLVAGLGASLLVRMGARAIVVGLAPALNLTILVAVPVLFVAAGVIACYVPARRASRVDPQIALRTL